MKVITHKNIRYYLNKLQREPQMQCGVDAPNRTWREWFDAECTLEFPLGELADDGLKAIALAGIGKPVKPEPLTGKEGFNAQGLEGKVSVRKPLINALLNMRDLLPEHRGRIIL